MVLHLKYSSLCTPKTVVPAECFNRRYSIFFSFFKLSIRGLLHMLLMSTFKCLQITIYSKGKVPLFALSNEVRLSQNWRVGLRTFTSSMRFLKRQKHSSNRVWLFKGAITLQRVNVYMCLQVWLCYILLFLVRSPPLHGRDKVWVLQDWYFLESCKRIGKFCFSNANYGCNWYKNIQRTLIYKYSIKFRNSLNLLPKWNLVYDNFIVYISYTTQSVWSEIMQLSGVKGVQNFSRWETDTNFIT